MKRWQFWAGILISIIFMYVALRGLSLKELLNVLPGTQWGWLIPAVGIYFVAVWARAWRWHYLLGPLKRIPTLSMFPIVCIGYAGNNIFPARAGEVLRAVVLKRHTQIPVSASLATIIVERVFDGVVMLGFVFLNLGELAKLTGDSGFIGSIRSLALWGSAVFVGVLAIFLIVAMFPDKSINLIERLVNRLAPERYQTKILGVAHRFLGGLASLRSPRDAMMLFVTSVVIWLLETGKYWLIMHAFPFQVSFFALMLMNGIVNLATTIPSAPGYIGTFDAPGIALLSAYHVPQAVAAAYTLVLHVALWLPITLVGLFFMAREGFSWKIRIDQLKAEAS